MYLSVHQFSNNEIVNTKIRLTKSMNIAGLRLGIYKHGNPDGYLLVNIKSGETILSSKVVTLSSLYLLGTYWHGMVLFNENISGLNLRRSDEYLELDLEIKLLSHTDDENNSISLKKVIENPIVNQFGVIKNNEDQTLEQLTHSRPFQIELFEYK